MSKTVLFSVLIQFSGNLLCYEKIARFFKEIFLSAKIAKYFEENSNPLPGDFPKIAQIIGLFLGNALKRRLFPPQK